MSDERVAYVRELPDGWDRFDVLGAVRGAEDFAFLLGMRDTTVGVVDGETHTVYAVCGENTVLAAVMSFLREQYGLTRAVVTCAADGIRVTMFSGEAE